MRQMRSRNIICFGCAQIIEVQSPTSSIICPKCGYEMNTKQYYEIVDFARDAYYFGFDYRRAYEDQLMLKGSLKTHYYLAEPFEIAVFIAAAVVSGIIGNASYDVVKKAVKKILGQDTTKDYNKEVAWLLSLTENEQQYNTLVAYIKNFCDNLEGLHPDIKDAIREEMMVTKVQEKLMEIMGNPTKIPTEEEKSNITMKNFLNKISKQKAMTKKEHEKLIRKVESDLWKKKLKAEDFNDFWKYLG